MSKNNVFFISIPATITEMHPFGITDAVYYESQELAQYYGVSEDDIEFDYNQYEYKFEEYFKEWLSNQCTEITGVREWDHYPFTIEGRFNIGGYWGSDYFRIEAAPELVAAVKEYARTDDIPEYKETESYSYNQDQVKKLELIFNKFLEGYGFHDWLEECYSDWWNYDNGDECFFKCFSVKEGAETLDHSNDDDNDELPPSPAAFDGETFEPKELGG